MALPGSSPKPLVDAQARDPHGSVRESSAFAAQGHDLTFLPGYSDKRQDIDDDLRKGRTPSTGLTHRFHWVRNQHASGSPNMARVQQFLALGYRLVKFDEAKNFGVEVPVVAFQSPTGYIQNGDCVLMVCDAATAHRIEQHGRTAVEERTTNEFTSGALHSAGQEASRELGGVGNDLATSKTEHRVEITRG